LQRLRKIRDRPATPGALAIQIIPAIAALQPAAASTVPQVGLFEGGHADLAAALRGLRTEDTVPPLLLAREYEDAVFDTELAAAMLEAPASLIAHHQGTARTGEGERSGVEATVTQAATPAIHSL